MALSQSILSRPALWPLAVGAVAVTGTVLFVHHLLPPAWDDSWLPCLVTLVLSGVLIIFVRRQAVRSHATAETIAAYAEQVQREAVIRREVELELRRAHEQMRQAHEAKDRFLAVLSHELRTPLTPMLAIASLWEQRADLPSDAREDATLLRRDVELEARLIDDLLDVSRIANGKLEIRTADADVAAILRDAVEMCRSHLNRKRLSLSVQIDTEAMLVRGDAARLQQVFWNLLNNAAKFTPEGGRVEVGCQRRDAQVVVEVRDNGIGIAPELVERVFVPFEQGGRSMTRAYGGLGLGLAICRGIIDLHGGKIHAHSPGPGEGAAFRVELPALAGRSSVASHPDNGPPQATPSSRLRILVVEDHQNTGQLLLRLLRALGHDAKWVADASGALAAAQADRFDLLISDLGLPDATGHELLRRLLERSPQRAIALSGYGSENDIRESQEAGFVDHLVKPVTLDQISHAIARAMNAPASQPATVDSPLVSSNAASG